MGSRQGMVVGSGDMDMALLDPGKQQFIHDGLRAVNAGQQKIKSPHLPLSF
jgi:hypothetical protein